MLRHSRNRGFSLLELAAVVTISGVLLATFTRAYGAYLQGQRLRDTYDRMDRINMSMEVFFAINGRYPCPARPKLPPNDPNEGVEACAAAGAIALGACDATTGLCRAGGRDTAIDVDALGDPVFIGILPYKTLRDRGGGAAEMDKNTAIQEFSRQDTLDGWGRKMTYAVTQSQTVKATFERGYGAIGIKTETGASLANPPGSIFWALVSHGENGLGAYTGTGGGGQVPCAGTTSDIANCTYTVASDFAIINGIRSTASGANYFDDMVYAHTNKIVTLWETTPTPAGAPPSDDIYNTNTGNVGVGLTVAHPDPVEKLDVVGALRTGTSLQAAEVCNSDGTKCFNPTLLGSTAGSLCASLAGDPVNSVRIMTGIKNGALACALVIIPTSAVPQPCPATVPPSYMVGIDLQGNAICQPFNW